MTGGDRQTLHNTTTSPHWVTLPAEARYVVSTGDRMSVVGPVFGLAEVERYCREEVGDRASPNEDVIETYQADRGWVLPLKDLPEAWRMVESAGPEDLYVLGGCDSATGPFSGLAEVARYCRMDLVEQGYDAEGVIQQYWESFEITPLEVIDLPPGWRGESEASRSRAQGG